jgi:hypothetical protein
MRSDYPVEPSMALSYDALYKLQQPDAPELDAPKVGIGASFATGRQSHGTGRKGKMIRFPRT